MDKEQKRPSGKSVNAYLQGNLHFYIENHICRFFAPRGGIRFMIKNPAFTSPLKLYRLKLFIHLILFFCSGLCLVSCTSQTVPTVKTNWEKDKLQGKVKSIHEYSTDLDSLGNMLDSTGWHTNNTRVGNIYSYNESGFLTEWMMYGSYDGNRRQVYTYNSYNQVEKIESLLPDNSTKYVSTYTYSKSGLLLTVKDEVISNDKMQNGFNIRIAEKYDANGYVIKSIAKTDKKESDYYTLYEFDNRGNKMKEEHFEMNGDLRYSYEYMYDSNDNKILQRSRSRTHKVEETRFTYDSKGNMLSLITLIDEEPFVLEYSYKYDTHGNWIERTTLINGVKKSLDKRVINYY